MICTRNCCSWTELKMCFGVPSRNPPGPCEPMHTWVGLLQTFPVLMLPGLPNLVQQTAFCWKATLVFHTISDLRWALPYFIVARTIFLFQNGCNYNKTNFLVEFKINNNSSYSNLKPNGCIFVNHLRRIKSTVMAVHPHCRYLRKSSMM